MTLILGQSYYTLLPRLTHLAAGVLAACAALTSTILGCLPRHKGIHNAIAAAALALVTVLKSCLPGFWISIGYKTP